MDETKSSEEIEKELIEKDQNSLNNLSPEDRHGMFFSIYGPRLKMLLKHVGKKGLERIINSLIQYPLNMDELKFTSKHEKEVYALCNEMLISKYSLVISTLLENEKKKLDEKTKELNKLGEKSESNQMEKT